MARKGSFHGKTHEKKAVVDSVSSDEMGVELKKNNSSPAMPDTVSIKTENNENTSFESNSKRMSGNKSWRFKGSVNGKHGSTHGVQKDTVENFPSSEQTYAQSTSSRCRKGFVDKGIELEGLFENSGGLGHISSETSQPFTDHRSNHFVSKEEDLMNANCDDMQREGHGDEQREFPHVFVLRFMADLIQKQKPVFLMFFEYVSKKKELLAVKVQHVWPKIFSCLFYLGKLLFLISVLWLDCCLRGLHSLFRLGTSSFLVILWCAVFNVIAMEGLFSVLLILGLSCITGFFLGSWSMIAIIAIFGTVAIWFHGWFWMTSLIVTAAGIAFALSHEHLALLITVVYSFYSTVFHVGWIGAAMCMNLSFISSGILIGFVKYNSSESNEKYFDSRTEGNKGRANGMYEESTCSSQSYRERVQSTYPGDNDNEPSTSGMQGECSLTPEEEVIRLLNSPDHYAVLGLSRFAKIDVTVLKREYRRKAMLVHPDKNKGDLKAEEAFKKLQNAYEVLLDSVKKKIYDDELRRDEFMNRLRSFRSGTRKYGSHEPYRHGNSTGDSENMNVHSKRIVCKKCKGSHVWIETERAKSRARWCQDCQNYHQAKDGDGWFEQSSDMIFFGMLRKVNTPRAYGCVEGKVYDATEWVNCQGLRCPANTHKASFQINTTVVGKDFSRGFYSNHRNGATGGIPTNLEENMTEEEIFEWFQDAVAKGMFDASYNEAETSSPRTTNQAKYHKKKRRGKKEW